MAREAGRERNEFVSNNTMAPSTPVRLIGVVKHYHWGSREFLANLRGRPSSERPEAELWFGTHPGGASTLQLANGQTVRLAEAIESDRDGWLGRRRISEKLTFLLKLLAAAAPLSIQVHPSRQQAIAGHERETSGALRPEERVYKDPYDKPEILRALTPFVALYGFRPRTEIFQLLDRLELATTLPRTTVRALVEAMVALRGEARADFASATWQKVRDAPHSLRQSAIAECEWVDRLAEHYPEDPWILAPLLMNLVHLQPGEALFTEAGVPHAYLHGLGCELMNSSDNVVRAGLTSKPIDQRELLRIVDSRVTRVDRRAPSKIAGSPWSRFDTPAQAFELSQLETTPQGGRVTSECAAERFQILMVARGQFEIGVDDEHMLSCGPTEAVAVPARCERYRVSGEGLIFRAQTPERSS